MHIPTPEEIRERRELLGMKQAELAEKAGISQSMVARIEKGSVDPRVSTLKKIVDVLNARERPRITAGRVMHAPVICVSITDPITHAAEIMEKYGISQLPVLEGNTPVGSISGTAILNAIHDRATHRGHGDTVKDYMEPGFPTVRKDTDIESVIRILAHHHAVLVMEEGRVSGVITTHDLISLVRDH
ncbi:MAG: CBS domain-containing protein [Methanolinea sp.]|nr:CBS domain-containing protein [Methanolinea sp.]